MKALAISAAAAAAGLVLLAVTFPRTDPSASLRVQVDRTQAIDRARKLSLRYGVDTAGWRATVFNEASREHLDYEAEYPRDPAARLFSPMKITVVLRDPAGKRTVQAALFPDGRPDEWRRTEPSGASLSGGPAAEDVLADFTGSNRAAFTNPATFDRDGMLHRTWEWPSRAGFPLAAKFETEQRNGVVVSAKLTPLYGDPFDKKFSASKETGPVMDASLWIRTLAWFPALGLCFWWAVKRRLRYRVPLLLLSLQLVWAAVSFWGSTYLAELSPYWRTGNNLGINLGTGAPRFGWSAWAGLAFFSFFVFAGAGQAFRSDGNREKWLSLDLLSRGRIRNRSVGSALAIGTLAGLALAPAPYIVAAVSKAAIPFHSLDAMLAMFPAAVAIRLSAAVLAVELFGFAFPMAALLRNRWVRWGLFVPVGVLLTAAATPFSSTTIAALVCGALLFAGYTVLYLHTDLLALMTAMIAGRAIVTPFVLLYQPAGPLRASGFVLLGAGAALTAVFLHLARRAPAHDAVAPGEIAAAVPDDSELDAPTSRERLQAEFEVAGKAQRDALPSAPPAIDGFSLAGSCEPAKQVGGDLYDFFPLPDGRLGIAVADVSGKGVPAALYMMVTKGLLTAISRDSGEIAEILQQTNLHLYRACRRKVFVTMAALALDPATRRLQYGRAGHNPVVWRRARLRETVLLKPQGLGLGMAPNEAFKRNLEVQDLEFEPGDALVLYSDGITEAVNERMEQYGEDRLMRVVEAADGLPAGKARDIILRDLAGFMGSTPARDDITVVVLRADEAAQAA
jgi:hypothetical protein